MPNYGQLFSKTFKDIDFVKSFFILVLAVSGNFVGETLSCQTRTFLQKMYAKDILIFILLYFGLDLMHDDSNNPPHPIVRLKEAFLIWIFYTMFSRMTIIPTILAFTLLCVYYILLDLITYYEKKENPHEETYINKLKTIKTYIMNTAFLVVVIGFLLYFLKEKKDYGKNFSIVKFFRGVKKCKHN